MESRQRGEKVGLVENLLSGPKSKRRSLSRFSPLLSPCAGGPWVGKPPARRDDGAQAPVRSRRRRRKNPRLYEREITSSVVNDQAILAERREEGDPK